MKKRNPLAAWLGLLRPTCNPWIGLLLCSVFGLQVLYYQSELNKIVDAYGVPEGTEIALRG